MKKKTKVILIIAVVVLCLAVAAVVVLKSGVFSADKTEQAPQNVAEELRAQLKERQDAEYDAIQELILDGKYDEAYERLLYLHGHDASEECLKHFKVIYDRKVELKTSGDNGDEFGSYVEYVYEHDSKGNVIKETEVSSDGYTNRVAEYAYDDAGALIKEVVDANGWDDVNKEYEYVYDFDGKLVKKIITDNGIETEYEYFYDNNGKKIKEVEAGFTTREYSYDDNGNLIKITEERSFIPQRIQEYFYDEDNNLTKMISAEGNEITEYDYNDKGDLVKKSIGNGVWKDVWEYSYDEKGSLIKENRLRGEGKLVSSTEYNYNSKGLLLKETQINSGYDYTNEYTYEGVRVVYCP